MFEEFIWYFEDKPCLYCRNFGKCGADPINGDEACMAHRLVRIVSYGNGDCWEEKKKRNE